jgi:hypothetical protein
MIRLIIAVGLLVCGAWASATAFVLSGQTPAPPAPPAGAQAAGFTTLAKNYDFSDPSYATTSNWLSAYVPGSPPNNAPGSNFQWYQILNCYSVGPTPPPASLMTQAFDAAAGKNVLKMHWPATSYGAGATPGCSTNNYQQIITEESNFGPRGIDFPENAYIEILYRMDRNSGFSRTSPGVVAAFWTYGSSHSGYNFNPNGPIEKDISEVFQDFNNSTQYAHQAVLNWGTGNPGAGTNNGNPQPLLNPLSSYQKVAFRTTGNGTTTETCWYINDGLIQCSNDQATAGQRTSNRDTLRLQCGNVPVDMDCYVQYVRVWSCANWQTTQCNGTVLTGPP